MRRIVLLLGLAFIGFPALAAASAGRESLDLSGRDWSITLDFDAVWENEDLHLPPVDVSTLPVRIPTGGWALLERPQVRGVHLPATVEEYLWGWNGETFGVTGNYVGVSWFETEVDIPADWQGRRVSIDFEAVRFRAEVFVNHKLVGYDLVNSTPFSFDVSDAHADNIAGASPTPTATSTGRTPKSIPGVSTVPTRPMASAASPAACSSRRHPGLTFPTSSSRTVPTRMPSRCR